MNPRIIMVVCLIGIILFLALSARQVTCNPPYMRVGDGCCLDSNNNGLCDRDETYDASLGTTSTTLDACASLTADRAAACYAQRDAERALSRCVEKCGVLLKLCEEPCEGKWIVGEKDACRNACFDRFNVCKEECRS